MTADPQTARYRDRRRAFIAAVEAAGGDVITRAYPARRGDDGKPLFLDSAALGPRLAERALLLLAHGEAGAAIIAGLLDGGLTHRRPADARLILVQGLDLFGLAGGIGDWPGTMLLSIATEDLARATRLTVLELDGVKSEALEKVLARPGRTLVWRRAGSMAEAAALADAVLAAP